MSPAHSTENYTENLSQAIFSRMDPGRPVLRLLDPATNELCEYRLVKIPRRSPTSPACPRLTRRRSGEVLASTTPDLGYDSGAHHPTRSALDGRAAELWHGPPSFGARLNSPLARLPPLSVRSRGDGTPSLFNDTRASDASTPSESFGPTPVRQLFPGAARLRLDTPADSPWADSGASLCAGLGFSRLRKDDGTPFDGLGSLPRRASTPHTKRTFCRIDSETDHQLPFAFSNFAGPRATSTPVPTEPRSPPRAPARHPAALPLPSQPDQDDVFLERPIRVPGSLSRGLFRRRSSSSGAQKMTSGRRASVAGALAAGPRGSWDWIDDAADGAADRRAERRPVWRP